METNDLVVFLLKNETYLVGVYERLDEEPSCYITDCFKIIHDDKLEPFPLYSKDRDALLSMTDIITMFEPTNKIVELYKKYT